MSSHTRPYRLLCAIDSLTGGGAERVLVQLANRFDPALLQVQIVLTLGLDQVHAPEPHISVVPLLRRVPTSAPRERLAERCAQRLLNRVLHRLAGLPDHAPKEALERFDTEWLTFCVAGARFGAHVRAWRPHCVLSFLQNSNLIALASGAWQQDDTPVICSDRTFLSRDIQMLPWRQLRQRFVRAYYPRAARHIAVSHDAADDLRNGFGVSSDRIVTIPNGVDIARIRDLARSAPPPDGLGDPDEARIIAVGRLHRQKGFDLLLEALAQVRHQRWRLLLLGTGPDEAELRILAERLRIAERIHFVGWDPNPYRWLAASDLFVLSSRWEGMPNVLLEAMAVGLPVIAMDCPSGPAEILDGGAHGRLVEQSSVRGLSTAIEALVASEDLRKAYSSKAALRVLDFTVERTATSYQQVILDTIEARERRRLHSIP